MRGPLPTPPAFVKGDPLLEEAFVFAHHAHHGPRRQGDTDIDHPVAVAELLASHGFSREIVAAALLHDVIEDTRSDPSELADRFGYRVSDLVREMTEDTSLSEYRVRKAEHRERMTRSRSVAAIYCADKLANTRDMEEPEEVPGEKLDHYQATFEILCDSYPQLPFLEDLRAELARIRQARASAEGASAACSPRGDGSKRE